MPPMKFVERRLSRLEHRLAPVASQQIVVSLYDASLKLALDHDTRIRILRECRAHPSSRLVPWTSATFWTA